ncbi:hypothetical protein HYV84_02070 [Candidatus Woesearchaeota archaeon]|nr:hypothetical protein [Candidatus Woesearchaeota archaeon]
MGKRNWNVMFLILFLLITPSAISAPYNLPGCLFKLSGGESPDDPILVDDDLEITLYDSAGNFKGDLVLDHDSRGSSFSEQFSAVSGDKIKISAWDANPCKRMLSPIFIHYPDGGKVKLTEGVPDQEVSEQYIASNPSAGGCNKASTLPRYDPDYKEEDVVYYRYGKDETKKVMQEKFFGPLEFTVDFVCPCKRIEPADDGANGLDVGYSEGETGLSPNSFFGASDYCSDGKSTIPGSQYPADTKSGFFVVQGKCEGNQVQFDAIQCPQGSTCYSGRCSRDCIDTDPPWSPQRPNGKGTTSGIAVDGKTEVSHEDYCTTWVDRSGYLKEDLSILPEAQFKKMAEGGKYREIKYLIINSRGIGLLPNAVIEGTCKKNPKAKDPNAEYVTLTRSFCNNQPCINGECVNGASLGGKPFLRPMGYRNFLDRYARSGKTITVPEREIAANEFEPLECGINGDRLFDNLKADFTLYSVREGGELESQNCLPNGCGDLTSGPLKEKIAERKGITCNMFGCSGAFLPSDSLRVDVGPSTMVTGKKWKPGKRLMCEISVGGVSFYSMPLPIRGNVKNEIYYSKDSVFVISDEKWQDVLKFVPVSIWEDGSGKDYSWCNHPKVSDGAEVREKCAYPYLIFHKESDFVDTRSVAYFINKQYIDQSSGQVASVNFLGQMPKTHGILGKEFKIFSPDDYFNPNYFWRDFSTVVIASDKSEDYGEGLLASQLSSYLNAPLIFLSKDSLDKYSGIFRIPWKKLSLVVMPGVDWELTEKLRSEYGHFVLSLVTGGLLYDPNAAGSTFKDTSQVQRLIQTFKKTNKVIITNPKDMSPAYCEQDLKIDPFPPFKEWYCKMSLAAPILASSRDWLIAFASPSVPSPGMLGKEASSSAGSGTREDGTFKGVREGSVDSSNRGRPSGSDAFEKEIIKIAEQEVYPLIGNIFNLLKPEYALFLAAPKALPLSKIKGASEVQRLSLDRYYVDRDNNQRQDIPFSRLYTKTISGVSSLMNRIIFNTQQEKNTFLSIAHSFESLQTHFDTLDAQLPGLGYDDADCFLAYDPLKRCQKDVPPSPFDAYIGKKVIYYDDHGSSGEWTSTIPAKQLPELSASLIISDSCLTNDYYHSPDGYVFGPEAIEKGALAYLGGVGTTVAIEGIIQQSGVGEDLFRLVVNEKSRDVGTSLMELYEKIKPESSDYILLGDPTYSPAIPKFSYPFIIKHSLSDTMVMGASFSFSVSDLKGPDEVGIIQVTALRKDGKVIKELAPKCEKRGNAITCEQMLDDPQLNGEILFEIKAFDKANKNYGAVYKDVKITPIDLSFFRCDEGIIGEKTTCTSYIKAKRDDLGDISLVKENGGVINPPNPALSCNWETNRNEYRPKWEAFF